jgi:hypothetical protein
MQLHSEDTSLGRDLDVGKITSLAPNLTPFTDLWASM